MTYVPNELLSRLVCRDLATVVFLKGYLQLTFDGPILTCYVWPTVDIEAGRIRFGDPGYRDALCSLLAETVIATYEATGQGLVIELESGSVRVNPAPEDLTGPEIAMLTGFDDGEWMVWRPGEVAFEDLA